MFVFSFLYLSDFKGNKVISDIILISFLVNFKVLKSEYFFFILKFNVFYILEIFNLVKFYNIINYFLKGSLILKGVIE